MTQKIGLEDVNLAATNAGRRYRWSLLGDSFNLTEAKRIIEGLLTRKERGNGLQKAMLFALTSTREHKTFYRFWDEETRSETGFNAVWDGTVVTFNIFGAGWKNLLERLGREERGRIAAGISRARARKERVLNRLRRAERYRRYCEYKKRRAAQVRVDQSANLRRHFKNSNLSKELAIKAIAYAVRRQTFEVDDDFGQAFRMEGAAMFRLPDGFVFRLELTRPYLIGSDWEDVAGDTEVLVYSTKENRHSAHRRLRSSLRKQLGRESKARRRSRTRHFERRKLLHHLSVLAA